VVVLVSSKSYVSSYLSSSILFHMLWPDHSDCILCPTYLVVPSWCHISSQLWHLPSPLYHRSTLSAPITKSDKFTPMNKLNRSTVYIVLRQPAMFTFFNQAEMNVIVDILHRCIKDRV